jgi:hypothetical protein
MARQAIEVRECDRCGKEPANTWTIIGPDGAPREIELCERHGAAVANAYALGRPVARRTIRGAGTRVRRTAPAPVAPAPAPGAPLPSPNAPDIPPTLPPAPPEPIWR